MLLCLQLHSFTLMHGISMATYQKLTSHHWSGVEGRCEVHPENMNVNGRNTHVFTVSWNMLFTTINLFWVLVPSRDETRNLHGIMAVGSCMLEICFSLFVMFV